MEVSAHVDLGGAIAVPRTNDHFTLRRGKLEGSLEGLWVAGYLDGGVCGREAFEFVQGYRFF